MCYVIVRLWPYHGLLEMYARGDPPCRYGPIQNGTDEEGLWEIVEGEETAPSADDAGYAKFVVQHDWALAIVIISIDYI